MELKPKEICGGLLSELPGPIYFFRIFTIKYYDDLKEALQAGEQSSDRWANTFKKDCQGLRAALARRDAFADVLEQLKGKGD